MDVQKEVREFADAAASFREWVDHDKLRGSEKAKAALLMILDLYTKALKVPFVWNDEAHPEIPEVSHAEWQAIYGTDMGLPLDRYGVVFNPLDVPPEEPDTGSLHDDIADIYRDVVTGLRLYEAGHVNAAVASWHESVRNHWGWHATGAIRTLHWWLTSNYAM
jgi:hypothetical protein